MTQGIFIGSRMTRPASKKAVKEAVEIDDSQVYIEATSLFGNEYSGPVSGMPFDTAIYFVGPDPYTKRNFYGTIKRTNKGIKIT